MKISTAILILTTCWPMFVSALQPDASQNAADYYRQAAAAIEQLSEHDVARIESTGDLNLLALYAPPSSWTPQELIRLSDTPPIDEMADTVAKLGHALTLFRQGANSPDYDWGFDFHTGNLSTPIAHLGIVTDLVRCTVFRARYYWATGDKQEAVADLEALKTFATHVGADGDAGLISLAIQYNIERVVVDTIARWLTDSESAEILKEVAEEPKRPRANLAKQALLLETKTVLPLAQRLIDSSGLTAEQRRAQYEVELFADSVTVGELVEQYSEKGLLDQIQESQDHYRAVGRLLDAPVDAFQKEYDNYMRTVRKTRNFFSGICIVQCPGIERVYYDVKEMHVRWKMLSVAIDIHDSGVKRLRKHKDPFGDGPFEYTELNDGFVLSSGLVVNDAPVTVHFASESQF
jgi:hypothetical protein